MDSVRCELSESKEGHMELTSNQKDLLEKFSKFIESESRVLMIQGYAGTGKTFMIGALAKQLAEIQRSVSLLAPTGRAARVLQEKTGRLASTIHRAIYDLDQVTVREDDPGLFKYVFKTKESASDNLNITYFVDEASLISDHHNETEFLQFGSGKLLSDLVQFLRLESPESRAKLVLVGDPAQLTPVGMDCSPALDPSYIAEKFGQHPEVVELTEVVRQIGGSSILQQATEIRESIRAGQQNRLVISASPPEVNSATAVEMIQQYSELINADPPIEAICITRSNAKCLGINHAVRAKIFGGDGRQPVVARDSLLVIRNNLNTGLSNGDLVRVAHVENASITRDISLGREKVRLEFRKVEIGIEHSSGGMKHDVYILENALNSPIRDITPLEQKALFVDFVLRHPGLKPQSKEFSEALRADPFFNALQVKFGYAMTCHKAQGGEWDHVFVLFEDGRTDLDSLRWAYTAMTRASRRLTGVSLPNRRPWTKAFLEVRESSVQHAAEPGTASIGREEYQTKWDDQFVAEQPLLIPTHHAITRLVEQSGSKILTVVTRFSNYFWRYEVKRGESLAIVQVNFNKKAEVTVSVLNSAGTDALFSRDISQLISENAINALRVSGSVEYKSEHAFLQEFNDEVVQPKLVALSARVIRLESLPYRERLHIGRDSEVVVLDVIYNGKGEITDIVLVRGSRILWSELRLK